MLFDSLRVGYAQQNSLSCSLLGMVHAHSNPNLFSHQVLDSVSCFSSLHGLPVAIEKAKTYGTVSMVVGAKLTRQSVLTS